MASYWRKFWRLLDPRQKNVVLDDRDGDGSDPAVRGRMTDAPIVLAVNGISKRYVAYASLLQRLARWFWLPVKPAQAADVLTNISFVVRKGESVALIGQNGAGKSTLLKIITGTVAPSQGSLIVPPNINAILELGLGFNMEFTARENVRQSGGMLGMSPQQIDAILPDIEAFAEIGEYFDQPMRTYSSGMQARVSFALVTAVRPEILIVDEVLSVGDSYFQHKSFAKIREFREQGTTIFLVSHGMGDVRELCDRVILLDKGKIVRDGPPDEVIDCYNALIAAKQNDKLTLEQRRNKQGWSVTRSGDFGAVVKEMTLYSANAESEVSSVRVGEALRLRVDVEVLEDIEKLVLGLMIRDRTGHIVWGTNTWHTRQVMAKVNAGERLTYWFKFTCGLGPGSYSISPALVNSDTHLDRNYEWTDNLFVFDVINVDRDFFIGSMLLEGSFEIETNSQHQ